MSFYSKWKRGLVAFLCAAMLAGAVGTSSLTVYAEEGENPVECTCETLCSTDSVNKECEACSADDADLEDVCKGKEANEPSGANNIMPTAGPETNKGQDADGKSIDMTAADLVNTITFGPRVEEEKDANGNPVSAEAAKWDDNIATDATGVLVFKYTIQSGKIPVAGNTYTMDIEGAVLKNGSPATMNIYDAATGKIKVAEANLSNLTGDKKGVQLSITYVSGDIDQYLEVGTDAYFWLGAQFNKDELSSEGAQDVSFKVPNGVTFDPIHVKFKVAEPKPSLELAKSVDDDASALPNGDTDGYITWKITAKVKEENLPKSATNKTVDLVITDTLPTGLELDSVKVGDTTLSNTETGDGYSLDNQTLTIRKSSVALSTETNTVTFTVKTTYSQSDLNTATKDGEAKWTNKASAVGTFPGYTIDSDGKLVEDGTKTVEHNEVSADKSITMASISKDKPTAVTGSDRVSGKSLFKWTVTAESSYSKSMILDTLSGSQKYYVGASDHPITIKDNSGTEHKIYSADLKTGDTGFDKDDTNLSSYAVKVALDEKSANIYLGGSAGKWTITYYTMVDENADTSKELKNDVTLYYLTGVGPGEPGYVHTEKSTYPGSSLLSKSYKGYDATTQYLGWEIKLTNNGYYKDTITVTDTFGNGDTDQKVHQSLVTDVVGKELKAIVEDESGTKTTYTLSDGKLKNDSQELGTYTATDDGFKLELWLNDSSHSDGVLKESFQSIVISYTTKMASTDVQNWINSNPTVKNGVSINDNLKTSASGNPETKVLKKETDGSYNKRTHEQSWKITVNESKVTLSDLKVEDTLNVGSFDKSDWKYDTDSIVVKKNNESAALDKSSYSVTTGTDSNGYPTMTITLPSGASSDKYVITYKTKLVNTAALKKLTGDLNLSNSVGLSGKKDDTTFSVNGDSRTTVSGDILSKSGKQDPDDDTALDWTIVLNDRGADLTEIAENDVITLTDTLQEGLDYIDGSVAIKEIDGKEITIDPEISTPTAEKPVVLNYDVDARVLAFKFYKSALDGKGYEITFKTTVPSTSTATYSNTAELSGGYKSAVDEEHATKVAYHYSGGFTFRKGSGRGIALLTKTDKDGKLLEGATYTLYKEDGKTVVAAGTTTKTAQTIDGVDQQNINLSFLNLRYGSYILKETKAPEGYTLDPTVYEINLSKDSDIFTVTATNYKNGENDPVDVTISKKAATGSAEVPGATLTLTARTEGVDLSNIEASSEAADYKTEKTYISWKSGSSPVELKSLPVGEYTLTETIAPQGYARTESIKFRVYGNQVELWDEKTSDYATTEKGNKTVTMRDEVLKGTFSKTTVAGAELKGAELKITVYDGTDVDLNKVVAQNAKDVTNLKKDSGSISWTSGSKALVLEQLPAGVYTLTETTAPKGYAVSEKIIFKVDDSVNATDRILVQDEDGKFVAAENATVTMKDAAIEDIKISKVAAGGTKELKGAKLALYEGATEKGKPADDKKVDSWTSGTEAHEIAGSQLKSNQDYTLVEIAAPSGYYVATNITFHIDEKGKVTKIGTTASSLSNADERLIVMADDAIKEKDEPTHSGGKKEHTDDHPIVPVTPGWEKIPTDEQIGTSDTTTNGTTATDAASNADEFGTQDGSGSHLSATGDDSMMTVYGVIAVMAAATLATWYVTRRKRQNI